MPHPVPFPFFFLSLTAAATSFAVHTPTPVDILLPLNGESLGNTVFCDIFEADECLWRLDISSVDETVSSFEVSLFTSWLELLTEPNVLNISVLFYRNDLQNLIQNLVLGDIIFMAVDLTGTTSKEDKSESELLLQLTLNIAADSCACGNTVHHLTHLSARVTIGMPSGCGNRSQLCNHYIYTNSGYRIFVSGVEGNIEGVKPPNKLIIFDGSSVDHDIAIAGLPCGSGVSTRYSCQQFTELTAQSLSSSKENLAVQLLADRNNNLDIKLQFESFYPASIAGSQCGSPNYYFLRPTSRALVNVSSYLMNYLGITCQWQATSYLSRHLGFTVENMQLPRGSRLQVDYFNSTLSSCTESSNQNDCNGISVGNNLTATLALGQDFVPFSFQALIGDTLSVASASRCFADALFLVESSTRIQRDMLLDKVMSMFDQLFLEVGYNRIAVMSYGRNETTDVFIFNSTYANPSQQQYALLQKFPAQSDIDCDKVSLGLALMRASDTFDSISSVQKKNVIVFSSGCFSLAENITEYAEHLTRRHITIFVVNFSTVPFVLNNTSIYNITANVYPTDNFYEISTTIIRSAMTNSCDTIVSPPTTILPSSVPTPTTTIPTTTSPPISCSTNANWTHSDKITIALLVEESQSVQSDFDFLKNNLQAIITQTLNLTDGTWITEYVFALLNSLPTVSFERFNSTTQMNDSLNAIPSMQSNQSSVNLYETIYSIQQNVTSRLLFLILTKNSVTDLSTFGQKAEIFVSSFGSNVILVTSAELCASLDQCPFHSILFSSSGEILTLQSQPDVTAIASSLASFYRYQLLYLYDQYNCTSCFKEFAVNIDNGISEAVNIAVYGPFGEYGNLSVFASADSGNVKRFLSSVILYVQTPYQRIFRINLADLYSNETMIIVSLNFTAGIEDRIFAIVRGRTAIGFESYIGFSNNSTTDYVQEMPEEGIDVLVIRSKNDNISFVDGTVSDSSGLNINSNQFFGIGNRNCDFNQFALEPISCNSSNYLTLTLLGRLHNGQLIQRGFFLRCAIITSTNPTATPSSTLPPTPRPTTTLATTVGSITTPSMTSMRSTTTTSVVTTLLITTTTTNTTMIPTSILTTSALQLSSSAAMTISSSTALTTGSSSSTSTSSTSPTTTLDPITQRLKDLAAEPITQENVKEVLSELNETIGDNYNHLNAQDIYFCSIILNNSAHVHNLDTKDSDLFLSTVDYLLYVDDSTFTASGDGNLDSTNRILGSFYPLVANTPDELEYVSGHHVGMTTHYVNCTNVNGQQVATNNNGLSDTGTAFVTNAQGGASLPVASITVPDTVICGTPAYKLFFMIFRNRKLFDKGANQQSRRKKRATDTDNTQADFEDFCNNKIRMQGSDVVTGTLLSRNDSARMSSDNFAIVTTSGDDTTLGIVQYSMKNYLSPLHGEYGTGWWTGDTWSSSGCRQVSIKNDLYTGHCTHLTDFGLIVTGIEKDPTLCQGGLRTVGYILSGSSSLTLFILLALFAAASFSIPSLRDIPLMRKLSGSDSSNGILGLPYLTTLFLYFFFFTVFIDRTVINAGTSLCNAIAAMLYTCLISVVFWTIVQGLEIVKRFYTFTKLGNVLEIMTKPIISGVFCIGVPISLTIALWFSAANFFNRNDCFCWVRPDFVTYAVVVPTSLLVAADVIFTGLVIQQFYFNRVHDDGFTRRIQSTSAQKRQRTQKVIVLVSMQIILGAPWVLQYFTIGTANLTAWHYLFTILNGSQGIMLGMMYALMRYNRHAANQRQQEVSSLYDSNGTRRIGHHLPNERRTSSQERRGTAEEIISDYPTNGDHQSSSNSNDTDFGTRRRMILPDDDDTTGYFS